LNISEFSGLGFRLLLFLLTPLSSCSFVFVTVHEENNQEGEERAKFSKAEEAVNEVMNNVKATQFL